MSLDATQVGARIIPVLVVGLAVPLLAASPTRSLGVVLGRAAAVLAVLVGGSVLVVQQDTPATASPVGGQDATGIDEPGADAPTAAAADDPAVAADESPSASTATPATAPTPIEPTLPQGDVPFPVETGFYVNAAYDSTASNEAGETATVKIAIGEPHVATSAVPQSTGEIVCPLGPHDAFFPFTIQVGASGLDTNASLRVSFGQGGVEGADPVAHPLSVQWNYAGGRQCLPGTSVATADDAASSAWTTLKDGEPQVSYGYLVVRDYFDPATGEVVAGASAGTGVGAVINDAYTTSEFTLTGGDVGVVRDPNFGDYAAVLFA